MGLIVIGKEYNMKKLFLSSLAVLLMLSGCTKTNSDTETKENQKTETADRTETEENPSTPSGSEISTGETGEVTEEELQQEIAELTQEEEIDSDDPDSTDIVIETEVQVEEGESSGGF